MLGQGSLLALAICAIIVVQWWGVLYYLKWFRTDSFTSVDDSQLPKAAIILAIRGRAPYLGDCLNRLAEQNYPDYRIHLVVDHPTDPANEVIGQWLATQPRRPVSIGFLEDPSPKAYLKTSAVLQAVNNLDGSVGAIALADADTLAYPDWLRDLITPLVDDSVGVVTGNRWYDPTAGSWGSLCRAVYNAICVIPMYFMKATWGGSLAIKREVFDTDFFREKMTDTPCEDAAIQAAARNQGQRLVVQPDVMMFNSESCTLRGAFDFIKRQLIWTRLYHPTWHLLLGAIWGVHILLVGTFFSGIYHLVTGNTEVGWKLLGITAAQIISSLLSIELLHSAISRRVQAEQEQEIPSMTLLSRLRLLFAVPLGFVMTSYAMLAAALSRTVRWSGITYQIVPVGPSKQIPPGGLQMLAYVPVAQLRNQPRINSVASQEESSQLANHAAEPLIPPLQNNEYLVDLITEVSGKDRAEVIRRFKQEHRDLGGNVRRAMAAAVIEPYVPSDALAQFYAETDAFLYETLVWNRTALKNDMRRWIGEYLAQRSMQPLRVLSFGDGLGIDAYYLAELGHDVTYFDVSQPCANFARRIFDYGNIKVTMLADPDELLPESFDAIVCLDVLEHVPEPLGLMGWLSSILRSGGDLIVHAPFHYIDPAVQTHLRSNVRFSGDMTSLYEPHGLKIIAGRLFWNPIVLRKLDSTPQVPWQVLLGSHLLKTGRYWSRPHVAVGKMLLGKKELMAMVNADRNLE